MARRLLSRILMRPSFACLALLVAAASTSGCVLYADDDDDCEVPPIEYETLRNPETGACEDIGGGWYGCDGPVYEADVAIPDWGSCWSECEALDETTCQATPGCRAAYFQWTCAPWADCDVPELPPEFQGCWATAPSGPIQGGTCEGLDAYTCSQHDDCTATYVRDWNVGDEEPSRNVFAACASETWTPGGCYSDMDCPGGYECTADTECLPPPGCETDNPYGGACPDVCYGRCVPAQNGCEAVTCEPGYHCELQCYPCDSPDGTTCEYPCDTICVPDQPTGCEVIDCGPGSHCETVCPPCLPDDPSCPPCETQCVPDGGGPGTCDGELWCDSIPPACPEGTVPGISNGCWSGYCIPVEDCNPDDPGSCYEPVACDEAPPACPEGTTPGVRDGCYTGYCIPVWQCEGDVSCEQLGSEEECAARSDCTPVYSGQGCTCYPDGTCTCVEWSYERCQTGWVDPWEPGGA